MEMQRESNAGTRTEGPWTGERKKQVSRHGSVSLGWGNFNWRLYGVCEKGRSTIVVLVSCMHDGDEFMLMHCVGDDAVLGVGAYSVMMAQRLAPPSDTEGHPDLYTNTNQPTMAEEEHEVRKTHTLF